MLNKIDKHQYENRRNQICEQLDTACSEAIKSITALKQDFINEVGIKKDEIFSIKPHFQLLEEIKGLVLECSVNDNFDLIIKYKRILKNGNISIHPSTFVLTNLDYLHKI